MTSLPLWRVGRRDDPLAFAPRDLYAFNHRFDDLQRRFRTLYLAEQPETCLREVLADFRPNLAAQRRHVERFGLQAARDFAPRPVTAPWREQHVLAPTRLELDGPLVDLTDLATRQAVEQRHHDLLIEHGLSHLDLHEITTGRRTVTQAIAAELYDRDVSAVRFPSRLDGQPCIALFEGRGDVHMASDPIDLIDPPPEPLLTVTSAWGLTLSRAGSRR